MKLLNMSAFLHELDHAIEEQVQQLVDSRHELHDAVENGDDAAVYGVAPVHQAVFHTLGAYRWVRHLVHQHTIDLNNYWALVSHAEGTPCPPAPEPMTLAAIVEVLASASFTPQAVAARVLVTIKEFDDWLMAYWEDGDDLADCEAYQETLIDITNAFREHFGHPGVGQELPNGI